MSNKVENVKQEKVGGGQMPKLHTGSVENLKSKVQSGKEGKTPKK